MAKILAVGDIHLENQFFLDRIPQENEFAFSTKITSTIGSKIINASRVLQRLDNEVIYCGCIGSDIESQNAITTLKSFGLITKLSVDDNQQIGRIVVITPNSGKSSSILFQGANESLSVIDIEKCLKNSGILDAIYTGTNLPLELVYYLADYSRNEQIPIFLDVPNQHSTLYLKKINSVDFFMPNRQEAELLLNSRISSVDEAKVSAIKIREKIQGTIIITLDKDGCVVLEKEKNKVIHFPTQRMRTVDETGAGDIFRAVFTHHYLHTRQVDRSVEIALEIATNSTIVLGVSESINSIKL